MKEELEIHWHLIVRHEPIGPKVMNDVVLPALAEELPVSSKRRATVLSASVKKVRE